MVGLVGPRRRIRPAPASSLRRVNPFRIHQYQHGLVETVPDIIEFVVSDRYLDRPNLYPRQGTFLKVMALQTETFTQFDYDVIGEWEQRFRETGDEGISPGILDRIEANRAAGRKWFRECLAVIGRRGSKGYTGGLMGSYVTWNFMHVPGGPQEHYGIDRDKRITAMIFAGKKEQARDNLWRDWFNVITSGPCFSPYVSRPQAERLTLFAPTDVLKQQRLEDMGVLSENDLASIEIVPAPSTTMAARGPAMYSLCFDEMAHVVTSSAAADADQVYEASTPSLDQFGKDGFIYAPSSPWRRIGKFFENWQLAIEMNPDGSPAYPERMMLQLPSWGPYEDWEEAQHIPLKPPARTVVEMRVEVPRTRVVDDVETTVVEVETREVERLVPGPTFRAIRNPIQVYDDDMRQLERANPETFAVERRSRWSDSLSSYLNAKMVEQMFQPWDGEELRVQTRGRLDVTYVAHGDPANTNKRFGWAIGHRVWVPSPDPERARAGEGTYHAVLDKIACWDPADFDDHVLDYDVVMGDIEQDVRDFLPEDVSFDQFNVPATIGRLRKFVVRNDLPRQVRVREVSRTRPLNWRHAELFKAALNMGLVHAPMLDADGEVSHASSEAELELRFLEDKGGAVDHPTTGPVQTKDIADCHDDQTEVLTEHGWKLFRDVQPDERLATRGQDGMLTYQHYTDRVDRHYEGPMVGYEGHRMNFLVTPGHRMLGRSRGSDPEYGFFRADSMTWKDYLVPKTTTVEHRLDSYVDVDAASHIGVVVPSRGGRGGARGQSGWTDHEVQVLFDLYGSSSMAEVCSALPGRTRGAIYQRARKLGIKRGQIGDRHLDRPAALPRVDRVLFAKFLGFWLAEGRKYHTGSHKGYGVQVTQTKPEGVAWFSRLMDEMGWPHERCVWANGETVWNVYSWGLREYLRALCVGTHELVIPHEVFQVWSETEMRALLEGLSWGDGNLRAADGVHTRYSSSSKMLVDDVQRLMAHIGMAGQVRLAADAGRAFWRGGRRYESKWDQWSINYDKRDEAVVKGRLVTTSHYEGMVHCLTVPNGTLMTRRHGKAMWSGNCIMEATVTLLGKQMATFLGMEFDEVGLSGSAERGTDPYRNTTADRMGERLTSATARPGVGAARARGSGGARGMRRR